MRSLEQEWLAQIHRERDPHRQIAVYQRLNRRMDFFAQWNVLPGDTTKVLTGSSHRQRPVDSAEAAVAAQ